MPTAAKQGDMIVSVDIHIVMVPSPSGPVPTPLPHPFNGMLNGNLSSNVLINNMAAATVGSTADNFPPHIPTPPGTMFQKPPTNKATIMMGSPTVFINNKPAARMGDIVSTCADPIDSPTGQLIAVGNVIIG
ncbi:hypothetical protein FJY84_02850 [Candidatus Bathyarchaeota archaeon]|nr:hypothetical protein [Candidatus Bathyarchaeota archaeon]